MSPETLRAWVRKTQIDAGARLGITSDERARLKQLERENKDLRRANAILKDASIFFATEPGAQTRKAGALPLSYTRKLKSTVQITHNSCKSNALGISTATMLHR
jgi:hypothetical protein